jgi:hypothetical protein
MQTENIACKKEPVKGGGVSIYCGWDGGADGLHDESPNLLVEGDGRRRPTERDGGAGSHCGGNAGFLLSPRPANDSRSAARLSEPAPSSRQTGQTGLSR